MTDLVPLHVFAPAGVETRGPALQRAKQRLGQAKVGKIGHEILTD